MNNKKNEYILEANDGMAIRVVSYRSSYDLPVEFTLSMGRILHAYSERNFSNVLAISPLNISKLKRSSAKRRALRPMRSASSGWAVR